MYTINAKQKDASGKQIFQEAFLRSSVLGIVLSAFIRYSQKIRNDLMSENLNFAMHKWKTIGLVLSLDKWSQDGERESYLTVEIHQMPSRVYRLHGCLNLTMFWLAELSHRQLRPEVNGMDRNWWRISSFSNFANFHGTRTYFCTCFCV